MTGQSPGDSESPESPGAATTGTPDLLVVKEGSGLERVLPIGLDPLGIGRDGQSAVCLNSPYVSRHHARIERRAGGVWLVDLGSRNGVAVNGKRVVGDVALRPGDVIAITDVRIQCLTDGKPGEDTQVFEWHGNLDHGAQEPASLAAEDGTLHDSGSAMAPPAATPGPDDALRVDPPIHKVWIGGREPERRLSAQEFALVVYLWEHKDRVCTREELGDAIWGHGRWEPNMLHRLVHRLKEKIEPAASQTAASPAKGAGDRIASRYVQSIPWVGYRLTP
ncbi:MAG: hypothetical protein AVDCRST_MAG77-2273 [uncultured Chloroflexi bacterium]|uniref:FHA domain-containing protein n=1 Tax=uncultured Chloroflexota bacterium TaxID=166587 RepID=A0A6J4IK45_9CHLR|nr:MAG: hypothetical protein AVDCRST_MAG77-2273 [uncultured Chloroflexota bacterium]